LEAVHPPYTSTAAFWNLESGLRASANLIHANITALQIRIERERPFSRNYVRGITNLKERNRRIALLHLTPSP